VEEIFCEARVIKAGKTISSVHVDIRDGAGNLYNTAEFTYFNLRPKEDN
jgi:acyl-coenzyme A thioesterase PaaI-like protein